MSSAFAGLVAVSFAFTHSPNGMLYGAISQIVRQNILVLPLQNREITEGKDHCVCALLRFSLVQCFRVDSLLLLDFIRECILFYIQFHLPLPLPLLHYVGCP